MKRIRPLLAMVLALALICLGGSFAFADDEGGNRSMRGGAASVADPSSIDDWAVILGGETPNTANIGRIWTDKTVSTDTITTSSGSVINHGDSAFITALSALSSTSNVKSSSTTPLDIVLVLDASGSMDDSMDDGTKRIDALKSAANNFVNHIAEQNQGISDSSKQHQVSIVKFSGDKSAAVGNDTYYRGGYKYNYSQVMKAMSPCTDAAAFRNTINSINPAGSTRADYGLQLADSQTSNREDAKKIVIFFTDGSPTSSSGFESEVASSAVSVAKAMKDKKATVYTVGIFSGADPSADPSGASNENKFMHAVSSNYPEAAYTQNSGFWGGWDWNLGTRPDGSDFYKSATNADELKKVFDDISSEIVKGSGYPTNATEGAEHTSGYITFDDALGAYMQVDSFKAIALNGQTFENPTKTTAGNVDTYTFDGTVAMGDKSVSLGNVVITVTKSTDLAVGDKVQVKVPAALIPLRSYNVDQKSMTMTVSDTKPINVVYTSSLKPGVESLLANPDDAMSEYLQANSQEGKASFYSNDWKQGYLGNTIANFGPSSDNIYYYFTSDTPIYTDEACTQRAHQVVAGNTYWYKYSYYEMTDAGSGTVEEKEQVISFDGADAEAIEGSIGVNNQGAYFKAGTARLTYLNNLYKAKDKNATGTANDVLNPKWVGAGQVGAYLGNNGKLSVDLPGTLAVTKELKVPDGYSANDFADDSFEFTVAMPDGANKSFSAVVKNANGEQQGDAFTLKFDEEGKATHNLKAGETLYVYGLAGGWNYTVTESDRDGFTQAGTGLTGTITAGGTANAKVVNTYSASGTLKGEDSLKGEKVLTGRDWNSTDKFTFLLEEPEGSVGVPMPEGANNGKATVEVTQDGASADTPVSFNFGDITYTKPGVYTYEIRESKELSVFNPGVSASKALYEVVVTVTDEGHDGTLTVKSELTKKYDDDGVKLDNPEGATVAKFVNEYNTKEVEWSPSGVKLYTDATGSRPLEAGMFHVIACTNDPKAPLPQLQGDQEINDERDGVKWRGAVTSVEADGTILFPQATFTYDDLDLGQSEKTFTYKIIEVVKDGDKWRSVEDALAPNFTSAGVTYDPIIWTVEVTLKDDNGTLVLDTKCSNGLLAGGSSGVPVMFRFSNSYAPAAATAVIDGSKTLTGRDMAANETFGFELSAADDATQSAVASGAVTLPSAATVSGAQANEAKGFSFDEMSFTKPGEYTFNVNETTWKGEAVPATDEKGMQFDRSTKTVKVKVTDDHSGTLKAEVTYPNGAVAFTNKYATSSTYNGIQVEKTLTGRDMKAGEFGFVIKGNDASEALLADSDKQFTNPNDRAEGIADVMTKIAGHTFTQADSGKHFEFTVKEEIPEGAVQDQATGLWYVEGKGLYYDGANHVVTIDVADDGNGQLTTTTKVDGQETNVVSFANKYRAQNVSFDTANAQLNKILQGRDWLDSDSFDFTITALDGAPMPKRDGSEVSSATVKSPNSKDGDSVSFDFGQIEFTSDMVKDAPGHKRTFTYEVTENAGNLPGIQYSDNKAVVEVTVSDNGQGKLVASATTQNGTFVNRYSSELNYTAAGGLNLAKTLTGRDMTDGQFIIKITTDDEASAGLLGLPEGGREVPMPAAEDGAQVMKSALIGDVVLTQRDAGKTYSYKVVEQGTAPSGYTYDTAERTVTITVEGDPANGTLKATTVVSVPGDPEHSKTYVYSSNAATPQETAVVPFNNSYAASGEVGITATKSLTGRSLTDGEFDFALKYFSGIEDVAAATNDASGNVDFGSIKYTTEGLAKLVTDHNAVKTVKDGKPAWKIDYVAYEKTDVLPGGVSAQTQPIVFTVMVVDNGDGTLAATANTGNGLKFQNVYSTGDPVSVDLSGKKVLKSDAGLTPASIKDKFTFTVTPDDPAAPKPEHATATNDANGNVNFGSIKFTLDDLNKALGSNGTRAADADDETKGASSGEAATGAAGQSTSDQGSAAGADSEEQGNAAASDGTEQGQGAAVVTGEGTGGASVSTAANKVAGAEDADQASAQSDEPATRAGVVRSHTFTYKVTESGSADGVTNDTETKTVSFKVTDDGNGKLTVERLGAAFDPAFTFTNTYSVQPVDSSVTDQVTVMKNLTGRDMKAGEFEFQLLEGGNVVATGTNDASGKVALSPITYTEPGTHSYMLREVGGGTHKAGVEYDGSVFDVTTTVTDNGDGTLSVAHKVGNDANAVGFTNSYAPAATSVTLGASKVLNGKSLEDGEFSFALEGEDGTRLVATNDASGMVAFPAIQYSEAGTYQYTLSEVKGTESGVTYDETTYAVAVAVEDDGEGSLVATVSYEGGKAPVFNNAYQEPEGPAAADDPVSFVKAAVSGVAKTGDSLLGIAGAIAAVAAAAAAVAALSLRKKGKHAKK